MSYIGTEPKDIRSFGRTKFDYTATQGQTAFTGADDDGKVLAFTVGQIEVYVNGILMDDSDFTTTGTGTVTLASAANLNDVVNVVSFETNIPDSNYVPATGGTFSGDVDFGANKITYANIYAQLSDLPSASTYHGMFAHVHATGLAYYAHAGAWIPLAKTTGATFSDSVVVDAAAATPLTVDRSGAVGSIIDVQKDGSTVGAISNVGSDFVVGSSTGSGAGLRFDGSGNQMYASNSLGSARDNAVSLGASTVRFSNLYLGGGAYLGGTGAANKLDYYQEGTFTFNLNCGTSGSFTPRAGYTIGHYTRIGNLVHYSVRFESQGRSSPQGRIQIGNFPFNFKANITNGAVAQDTAVLLRGQDPPSDYMTYFFVPAQGSNYGYFTVRKNDSTHDYNVIDQSHIPGNFKAPSKLPGI